MNIEDAIGIHLKSLVTAVNKKVFQDTEDETCKSRPIIIFFKVSGVDDHCLGEDSDLTESRYQCTIKAKSTADRTTVRKQLKAAFKDFTGIMGGAGGVQVHSALQVGRNDSYDHETREYIGDDDYMIMYDES